jgi:thioesterase domain-containing protein
MAKNYIEKMRTVQSEGTYLVGGLCAGGIIAFEIACQLQLQGHKVGLVALIDADIQAPYKKGRISHQRLTRFSQALSQAQQKKGLNLLFYLLKTVTKKTKNLIIYEVKTKIKNLQNKFKIKLYRYYLDNSLPLPKFLQNISVRTIFSFAAKEYISQVYQDKVVLFRATKSLGIEDSSIDDTPMIEKTSDPLFGWGERAMGGVEVDDIPGGHSSCLQEPYVQVLAAKMEAHIKDALSGESFPSTVMAEKKSTKENPDV